MWQPGTGTLVLPPPPAYLGGGDLEDERYGDGASGCGSLALVLALVSLLHSDDLRVKKSNSTDEHHSDSSGRGQLGFFLVQEIAAHNRCDSMRYCGARRPLFSCMYSCTVLPVRLETVHVQYIVQLLQASTQSTHIGRDETGSVYLPTQLERTLQL